MCVWVKNNSLQRQSHLHSFIIFNNSYLNSNVHAVGICYFFRECFYNIDIFFFFFPPWLLCRTLHRMEYDDCVWLTSTFRVIYFVQHFQIFIPKAGQASAHNHTCKKAFNLHHPPIQYLTTQILQFNLIVLLTAT